MRYHQLPEWLPETLTIRDAPVKARSTSGHNGWVYEVRHWSDGWVARYHDAYRDQEYNWWHHGYWVWADTLQNGWDEQTGWPQKKIRMVVAEWAKPTHVYQRTIEGYLWE